MLSLIIFPLLYSLLFCATLLIMRHRYQDGDRVYQNSYAGSRPAYVIFFISMFINAIAICVTAQTESLLLPLLYIPAFVCMVVYQLYRLADFYLIDIIEEKQLIGYQKIPEHWREELSRFVAGLNMPTVLLGDHLLYGKAHGFFSWNHNKRCIDCHRIMNDQDILQLLKTHGVTHIALTPFSMLAEGGNSLGHPASSASLLTRRLTRVPTISPLLTIYAVDNAERHIPYVPSSLDALLPALTTHTPGYLRHLVAWFHALLTECTSWGWRSPLAILTNTKRQKAAYLFQKAIHLKPSRPQRTKIILLQLHTLYRDLDPQKTWSPPLVARIYYQLATLAKSITQARQLSGECLRYMPGHFKAKELYTLLSMYEAN